MRFVLLPWQPSDASLVVPPPAADGGVHFEATTESLHSLAVLDSEALVFDRHRMVVSHAWPLELVGVLDGETVTLDELGPIVVSKDGKLGHLSNWHEMTESEQAAALK